MYQNSDQKQDFTIYFLNLFIYQKLITEKCKLLYNNIY